MKTDVLPIRLNQTWVLVRATAVSEFLAKTPWLSVPGATPSLPGVMTWRGRAIPVLDLAHVLKLGTPGAFQDCSRVMIVQHTLGVVGIPVNGAREVTIIDDATVAPPHVHAIPYASGEVDQGDVVVPLIEIEQLLVDVGEAGA